MAITEADQDILIEQSNILEKQSKLHAKVISGSYYKCSDICGSCMHSYKH